jgi:hypothetical protein
MLGFTFCLAESDGYIGPFSRAAHWRPNWRIRSLVQVAVLIYSAAASYLKQRIIGCGFSALRLAEHWKKVVVRPADGYPPKGAMPKMAPVVCWIANDGTGKKITRDTAAEAEERILIGFVRWPIVSFLPVSKERNSDVRHAAESRRKLVAPAARFAAETRPVQSQWRLAFRPFNWVEDLIGWRPMDQIRTSEAAGHRLGQVQRPKVNN